MSDEQIKGYLEKLAQLPSIKYIRFHTRTPLILPSRITPSFCNLLKNARKNFRKVSVALHTNHWDELNQEVAEAISRLKEAQVTLLSQTVLLKRVNDNLETLKTLFIKLAELECSLTICAI